MPLFMNKSHHSFVSMATETTISFLELLCTVSAARANAELAPKSDNLLRSSCLIFLGTLPCTCHHLCPPLIAAAKQGEAEQRSKPLPVTLTGCCGPGSPPAAKLWQQEKGAEGLMGATQEGQHYQVHDDDDDGASHPLAPLWGEAQASAG